MKTISALREETGGGYSLTDPVSLPRLIALAFLLSEPEGQKRPATKIASDVVKELYHLARNPAFLIRVLWQMQQRPARSATLVALTRALRELK